MNEIKKYAPQRKWAKENKREYRLAVMKKTEADIIEHLEKQENKAGYIKSLIRADMQKHT
jgi:hypothetical protein